MPVWVLYPRGAGLERDRLGPLSRTVRLDGARLPRWVAGFSARHGATLAVATGAGLGLSAADGELADVTLPFPPWPCPDGAGPLAAGPTGPLAGLPTSLDDLVTAATAHVTADRAVAVLLVRRGGYACALVERGAVTASKVGSRYVQGRTAAGGWSQQRFARRRANQADGLVDAAVGAAVQLLVGRPAATQWLVTGGDRPLVDQALADPRLRPLAGLPRGPHLAIGDPKRDLVAELPARLREVSITLSDTGTPG